MSIQTPTRTPVVALIGNPNTGKSTLFNALSGSRQRVGNYPGCTVEKKEGAYHHSGRKIAVIDLPGTYSLAPRSPDEMVAVDVLLGRRDDTARPDAIISIVDASNLERNLYVVGQVLELGLPTVLALNMVDVAAARGIVIDVPKLEAQLGIPVVAVQAHKQLGMDALKTRLDEILERPAQAPISPFPAAFQDEVAAIEQLAQSHNNPIPRYLAERLLLDTSGYLHGAVAHNAADRAIVAAVASARERLKAAGYPVPAIEAMSRYKWVGEKLVGVVTKQPLAREPFGDRLDRVLTHAWWGTAAFVLLMFLMFQAVFAWATPAMEWIDGSLGEFGGWVEALMAEGALRSLIVDGIIAGVGGVLVFLPQIVVLFFFLGLLEDCGYLARAAYLMDKLMSRVGLSGKSFIPLLSSFACAIPGVMATRVIENRRDRLTTIMVAPLMSCSARLPVYFLLTAAFIPNIALASEWIRLPGVVIFGMYALGIVAAIGVAYLLKKTLLRGETPPFVMELPNYKWPSARNILARMWGAAWAFIYRAGTLIFAVSIVIWALTYYPRADVAGLDDLEAARVQREQSVLGRMGKVIEPVVYPLGWDWKIGAAAIASFPAREVVVAALGVIYNVGDDVDEATPKLHQALHDEVWPSGTSREGQKIFNVPVALSLMVFFALCAQCAATLAVIRRETNSWFWPIFSFTYMTVLAYIAALITYQVGMLFVA